MNYHKKTILCKVTGNSRIGTGHVYRSLGLARVLEKEFRVLFHINNNDQVKDLMQKNGVTYFVDDDLKDLALKEQIDLLLFDQLSDDNDLFKNLKFACPDLKIIALDYFNYENEFVDVIINLFNQNLQKSRPEGKNIRYYEGINYAIIRDEFARYIDQERIISSKVNKILITFGGVDHKKNTNKVLELFKTLKITDVNIDVVLGPLWQSELPKKFGPNIHFHHSISNMADYMVGCDLAFCGAGTTMLELLCVGTPAIVIPQNIWEERFAESVKEKGAIKLIKDDFGPENVKDVLNLLNTFHERKLLSQKGRSLVNGEGKKLIYGIIRNSLAEGK